MTTTNEAESPTGVIVLRGVLVRLSISSGGMPKLPIAGARITSAGVEGDWQLNRKHHGGPNRAICLYSVELYDWLRCEHAIDLKNGAVGENFTTRGIDFAELQPGDRLSVGGCIIEITKVRAPCASLNKWHPELLRIIEGNSGWLAKVIQEGNVAAGDPISVQSSTEQS